MSLLDLPELKSKTLTIGGQSLTIRELDFAQALEHYRMAAENEGKSVSAIQMATVISWAVVDEEGNRVHSDKDIPAIAKRRPAILGEIYKEVCSLSALEDDAKNS